MLGEKNYEFPSLPKNRGNSQQRLLGEIDENGYFRTLRLGNRDWYFTTGQDGMMSKHPWEEFCENAIHTFPPFLPFPPHIWLF